MAKTDRTMGFVTKIANRMGFMTKKERIYYFNTLVGKINGFRVLHALYGAVGAKNEIKKIDKHLKALEAYALRVKPDAKGVK